MQKVGDVIGDYRLVEEISAGALTRTWKAEQLSIRRGVILEILTSKAAANAEVKAGFVADIRAKAHVAHAVIGAVYEAVDENGVTFYAREQLIGKNLEDLYEDGKRYTARELVILLEQIGDAQRYLEKRRLAAVPLAGHHIVIDDQTVRIVNLVAAGRRDEKQAARDKHLLGAVFDEMLIRKHPGSTRVGSLLGFMADLDREIPLTWRQVRDLSRQVLDQFEDLHRQKPSAPAPGQQKPAETTIPPWVWAALGGIGAMAAVFGVLLALEKKKEEESVVVPEGPELAPISFGDLADGLCMAPHEVTVAEYAKFLESLSHLSRENQTAFDHPAQPEAKKGHIPDDWSNLLAAARSGGLWNERLVNEGCPVVGIDWWDAYAYCTWLGDGARLPTLKEWAQAGGPTEGISGWGKASSPEKDRTISGLIGMGGNVREWTRDPEPNPSAPLAPEKPVAAGGSFRDPASGHKARTWLDDRMTRADDLGFRVLFVPE
ncbi:MAG: SUMF1/EgtB/PvdO family nonheme iron enzyme [Akkermansiaceae bacterium]